MALDSMHEWLNSEFLEKALNSDEEKKLKVISSKIEKATAPGEHCASHIYRASLRISRDGIEESKSVIVKIELCDAGMGEIINKANAFQKEIDVYTLVIPNAEKLLEECAQGKYQPYAPKCYYTYNGPPASVIVMEDLEESGFKTAKHSGGLDINHCLLAINTLASYHAASAVLYARDSNKMEALETSLYTEDMRRDVKKLFDPTLRNLAFESETWPECKGEISSKLHQLISHSFDYLLDSLKTDEKDFKVLTHEDIRLNNILFRYSDEGEKPTEVRYVDFQLSQWTSPVIDLSYFIIANAAVDIVLEPKIIIEEYYKKLCETLKMLGHSHLCPSKEYLYDQYNKRSKFGVIVGLVVRCFTFKERSKVGGSGVDFRSGKWSYFSESYRNDMKKMLPYFLQRGWL